MATVARRTGTDTARPPADGSSADGSRADDRSDRKGRWRWLGPAIPVVVAVAVGIGVVNGWLGRASDAGTSPPTTAAPAPVAVGATSIYTFTSLEDLTRTSDAVVRGPVVAVARGRLVGDAGASVVSRIVTIRVDEVLAGTAPADLLVEEEGWLPDGSPLVVNGVAPSQVGDDAVWFLQRSPDGDLPSYLVVNSQGRFLVEAGALTGGDRRDELVRRIEALGPDELESQVRSLGASR